MVHFKQWFSTRGHFAPTQGIFDGIWRHFWLLQLGACYWHCHGAFKHPTIHREVPPQQRVIWPQMSIGLRFRSPGQVGTRRMVWIHDMSKLEMPAVSPQALGITSLLKPFLFPWGLFQVLPGGGVGVRTQPSKLIPRVLATSTTVHPTAEQERLKSKSHLWSTAQSFLSKSSIHQHTTVWQAFHILYQYTKVLTSALILVIRSLCPNWSTVSARWGQE